MNARHVPRYRRAAVACRPRHRTSGYAGQAVRPLNSTGAIIELGRRRCDRSSSSTHSVQGRAPRPIDTCQPKHARGKATVARIVQRINQSLCAPLMLILGAVLAIRLRGSNPLQVYLLAFIPSIVAVLLISGGEQMLRESTSVLGIFIATSGNIGLASMILIAYRQVARN